MSVNPPVDERLLLDFNPTVDYFALIASIPKLKNFSNQPIWLRQVRTCAQLLGVDKFLDGHSLPPRSSPKRQYFFGKQRKAQACLTFSISDELLHSLDDHHIDDGSAPCDILKLLKSLTAIPSPDETGMVMDAFFKLDPKAFTTRQACATRALRYWATTMGQHQDLLTRKLNDAIAYGPDQFPLYTLVYPDGPDLDLGDIADDFLYNLGQIAED